VENALLNAGAEVVDSPAEASAVLMLHSQRLQRRVLSVDTQGRAAEYELALQVVFSLRDSTGRRIADNERVSVIRDFSFDPDNVLAKSDEETALRKEMYRLAVSQMVRRVQSLARQPASGE
jgi:LPS-assembly lipoprotein